MMSSALRQGNQFQLYQEWLSILHVMIHKGKTAQCALEFCRFRRHCSFDSFDESAKKWVIDSHETCIIITVLCKTQECLNEAVNAGVVPMLVDAITI